MFCSKCGTAMLDSSRFCDQCGQPAPGQPGTAAPGPAPSLAPEQTSGKALASMITGIFGLLFFFPAIAAIILGHMSRSEIRHSNGRLKGNGMATAGLVMGYGMIAVIPFILIIAAIAIPNLLRARIAANEASAVAALRTVNTAELSYQSEYPKVGFACNLPALGGHGPSAPSADHAQLIDESLAAGWKNGYSFEIRNCVYDVVEGNKYQVVAYPRVRNQSGVRAFCSDQTGIVRVDAGGSPEDCLSDGRPL